MEVKINRQTYTYENKWSAIEPMFDHINQLIRDSQAVFSHLVIDDEEVYEAHDRYIQDRIESIRRIEVVLKDESEMMKDLFHTTDQYLTGALPLIDDLVDEFYSQPTPEAWLKLNDLLEAIQWLEQLIDTIRQSKCEIRNKDEYVSVAQRLPDHLQEMSQAMENKDHVLMADLIRYEIVDILQALHIQVRKTLEDDRFKH